MSKPVLEALASVISSSSLALSGATLTFYLSGTNTLQDVYTNTGLGTPASTSGVLTANSSGRFPQAFYDPALSYKAVLKDSGGNTLATVDPVAHADGFLTSSALTPYVLKAGGTMTGPLNFAESTAVASASAIDADAMTGNFGHITGTTNIATITLADGATRTFYFEGILTLTNSSNLVLDGADIITAAGMVLHFVGEGSGVTRLTGGITSTGKALRESAELVVAMGDETTAITAATGKVTFRMPFAMVLDALPRISANTAQASGNIVTVDIRISGTSIFATRVSLDNNETTSTTAATPCVLTSNPLAIADDAELKFDVSQCDASSACKGLKAVLKGYRTNA